MVKEVLSYSRYFLGDHGHLLHFALELVVDERRLELEDVKGRVVGGKGGVGRNNKQITKELFGLSVPVNPN